MKDKILKVLSLILIIATMVSSLTLATFALEWDGSSAGGAGKGSPADVRGFAVRCYPDDNCIGYRFSCIDRYGNLKSVNIDVFRNTSYGNMEFGSAYKFATKHNKKQLISYQNQGFSTLKTSLYCFKEADMGFATALPSPEGMGAWQVNNSNLNAVLRKLDVGTIDVLKNGDKIIVEPIYDVMIEGTYHAVTTTELALYGKYFLGANSDGGSSPTAASWGFISVCSNKLYPNLLYTPDGQGLWTSATPLSKRATFYTIINQGYGVGIAYTETKSDFSPNLNVVKCEAWPGNVGTRNSNHYGISYGKSFTNWTYGNGYPKADNTVWYALNFPAESQNCFVRQSVWIDGGGSASRNVWSNSNTWYDVSLNPTTISKDKKHITVKARMDWIDENGNVRKYGTEKSFYIPIRPTIYRSEVIARNIAGKVQANRTANGGSGSVYWGQRIDSTYLFTAYNSWVSANHVSGSICYPTHRGWPELSSQKESKEHIKISQSSPYTLVGDIGYVLVDDNIAADSIIRYRLTSKWASDPGRTIETNAYNISVHRSDVELSSIILVDKDGNVLNKNKLEVGDVVTVIYQYKNNTDCPVFVKGYNNDRTQITGIYEIPEFGSINVSGYSFEVPNTRSFSIWGGVYLESVPMGDTHFESRGDNNTLTTTCNVNHPVKIIPIAPNANYKAGTYVITSYYLQNIAKDDYIPSDNLKVKFTTYKINGTIIDTQTKNVIVPAKDENLVYFTWFVPNEIGNDGVVTVASIVSGRKEYNPVWSVRSTEVKQNHNTPNTQYEEKRPDGFNVTPCQNFAKVYTTWDEYNYVDNKFVKESYGVGIASGNVPASSKPATGQTHYEQNGKWKMKSGYGVSVFQASCAQNVVGYKHAEFFNAYVLPQYAFALLPEYNYEHSQGKCVTLTQKTINNYGTWCFPKIGDIENVHYTPLWYPDGPYDIVVVQSDFWTPMGMLSSAHKISNVEISGNMYDDWYIGRQ